MLTRRDRWWIPVFLAPYLVGFAVFIAGPVGFSLVMSTKKWNLYGLSSWIGFQNYSALLRDSMFLRSLLNTGYYAIMVVPGEIAIALLVAVLLNRRIKGIGLFRAIYFSPFVMSLASVALLWTWFLSPNFGLLSNLLMRVGIVSPGWLQTPSLAMPTIAATSIWRNAGYYTVILLAGLQAVPAELLEAAQVDGASSWRQFWSVVLPSISPTLFFVLVMATLWACQAFELPYLMTQGGPEVATLTTVQYIYMNAFQYGNMGAACAMSWVLAAIMIAVTAFYFGSQRKWVFYE
jgi:multiple sugar transport system permease protein